MNPKSNSKSEYRIEEKAMLPNSESKLLRVHFPLLILREFTEWHSLKIKPQEKYWKR